MVVTIKHVAERAGVSIKTVSRVINGEAHVTPAKREAVMRVVRELDYRPNAFARSLSSSRSYLLGLLIDDPASGYAADVQLGAINACRDKSYHLLVERVDRGEPDWQRALTASLERLRLDGALLPPPLCDDPEFLDGDSLHRQRCPVRAAVDHQLLPMLPNQEAAQSGCVGWAKGCADSSRADQHLRSAVTLMQLHLVLMLAHRDAETPHSH